MTEMRFTSDTKSLQKSYSKPGRTTVWSSLLYAGIMRDGVALWVKLREDKLKVA